MMVKRHVDFTEEVITSELITVPDHDTQRPRLQLTLRYTVLYTTQHTHIVSSSNHRRLQLDDSSGLTN